MSELREQDKEEEGRSVAEKSEVPSRPFDPSALTPMGVFLDTYIAATDEEAFYLIDQHAAHERVLYEQIRESFRRREGESQLLLTPECVELMPGEEDILTPLRELGFAIEDFGPHSYMVRAVPFSFVDLDIAGFLRDFADGYRAGDMAGEELRDRVAGMACKAAVKGHDKLRPEEVEQLLKDLAQCEDPFSCPHGRPTFLRMSKGELERNFKRA